MASDEPRATQPRDRLASRLGRLRGEPPTETSPRRRVPPFAWLLLAVAVLAVGLLYGRAAAPPAAVGRLRSGIAAPARLVAVTREAPHQYRYDPPVGLARALFRRAGDGAVQAAAAVPTNAVTIWLWVRQPDLAYAGEPRVTDEARREYVNRTGVTPLAYGTAPWGRATLVWCALTSFDQTARQLTFSLPLAGGNVVVTVDGPGAVPAAWETSTPYPLHSGGEEALVRLWHVRRVDPLHLADLLTAEEVPEPHDALLVADLDVVEQSGAPPGAWRIEVERATTDRGEALSIVAQRAGLAWLAAPHEARAIELAVKARKQIAGEVGLKFAALDLPEEPGQTASWGRAPSDEAVPFRIVCLSGAMLAPGVMRFTFEADAPAGTAAQLVFVGGLDDQGGAVTSRPDDLTLVEQRSTAYRRSFVWSLRCDLPPTARSVALACRLIHRTPVSETAATFIGRLLPARSRAERAGLGLLMQPLGDGPAVPFGVVRILPDRRAAAGSLAVGDELLAIDELPPALIARVLLRHGPDESVPVLFRRGGQLYRGSLPLDPLQPGQEPPAAEPIKPEGTTP